MTTNQPKNKENEEHEELEFDYAIEQMLQAPSRLGLGFHTSGRRTSEIEVEETRELTAADLTARIETNNETKLPSIQRVRDSHHRVAQLIAMGMKPAEVSVMTGFCPSYISNLQNDASIKELILFYAGKADAEFTDVIGRMKMLNLEITGELLHRLTNSPEELSVNSLVELLKATLDRTGHAPVSKSISVTGTLSDDALARIKDSASAMLQGKVQTI